MATYPKSFTVFRERTGELKQFHSISEKQDELSDHYYEQEICRAQRLIKKIEQDIEFYKEILRKGKE